MVFNFSKKRLTRIALIRNLKNITGVRGKNTSKKPLQDQEGKEVSFKTKKVIIKIYNIGHIYCLANCLSNFFPCLLGRPKCNFFPCTGHSGDSHGDTSTTSRFDLVLDTC